MIFKYFIDTISHPYYMYKILVNNDLFNIEIDLIKKYPNYKYINHNYNNKEWYYVLTKSNDKKSVKGEVIKLDMTKLNPNFNPNNIIYKKNEYRIANQMDLDKYYYIFNVDNDNSKLFRYIYNYIIFYYKNDYIIKQKNLKIKNRFNETIL